MKWTIIIIATAILAAAIGAFGELAVQSSSRERLEAQVVSLQAQLADARKIEPTMGSPTSMIRTSAAAAPAALPLVPDAHPVVAIASGGAQHPPEWFDKMYERHCGDVVKIKGKYLDLKTMPNAGEWGELYKYRASGVHDPMPGDFYKTGKGDGGLWHVSQVISGTEILIAVNPSYIPPAPALLIAEVAHVGGLNTEAIVDNQVFEGELVCDGTYTYTSTIGASRKIRSFVAYRPCTRAEFAEAIAQGLTFAP